MNESIDLAWPNDVPELCFQLEIISIFSPQKNSTKVHSNVQKYCNWISCVCVSRSQYLSSKRKRILSRGSRWHLLCILYCTALVILTHVTGLNPNCYLLYSFSHSPALPLSKCFGLFIHLIFQFSSRSAFSPTPCKYWKL